MSSLFAKIAITTGATAGSLLMSAGNADAFSFVTNTSVDNSPTGDVLLQSVEFDDTLIDDFIYVSSVNILENEDAINGPASTDKGDDVTQGGVTNVQTPTEAEVLGNLSNNNLNSIIDTEEDGSFIFDLGFGQIIQNLFVWERGGNSILGLQALDSDGNLLGSAVEVDSSTWGDAGFSIDTTEIGSAQPVKSLGIAVADFFGSDMVAGVRVYSEASFNGPDWKIIASGDAPSVPEPATVLGLTAVAGALCLRGRKGQVNSDA